MSEEREELTEYQFSPGHVGLLRVDPFEVRSRRLSTHD